MTGLEPRATLMDRNQLLTNRAVLPQHPRATQKDDPWILTEQLAAGILLTQTVLDSLAFSHFHSICPPVPSTSESLHCYINISKIKPTNSLVRQCQCSHFAGRGKKAEKRHDSLCGLRHVPRQSPGIHLCSLLNHLLNYCARTDRHRQQTATLCKQDEKWSAWANLGLPTWMKYMEFITRSLTGQTADKQVSKSCGFPWCHLKDQMHGSSSPPKAGLWLTPESWQSQSPRESLRQSQN